MLIVLFVFLFLLAAAVAFSILVGWKVSTMILFPNICSYDTVVEEEAKRGNFTRERFDKTVRLEEFFIHSPFGYSLHCALWPRGENAAFDDEKRRVAVFVHGFTYCLLGGIKYASIFHALGFDCVLFDHRNHGLSGKAPTTMGYCESHDLTLVCAWARERFGKGALIGTHGESMGAATVMLHAGQEGSIAFAVEDCGYSSFVAELRFVLRHQFHIPAYPILPIASLFSYLRGGVFFGRVVPKAALEKAAGVPMLFIHGDADELVPYSMLTENFDAKTGKKTKLSFPGAGHADCYRLDSQRYREGIALFLRENGVI